MGGKFEPWVIAPDVLLALGYVRRHILNKDRFHLRDCLVYLWMQMNEEQLGLIWIDLSLTTPVRIFQVVLESVLQAKPNQALRQVDQGILVENRKRRGDNLLDPGRNK